MAMSMHRAFNAKMLTGITLVSIEPGSWDEYNNWVEGKEKKSTIFGRVIVGNKFSQFEEGIALHNEDGGSRYSDYRSLYVKNIYTVKVQDRIIFKGKTFRILQQSDEDVFGFNSFLIEAQEK